MQTLHHRDGVYQVAAAELAHDVGVQLRQVHPHLLLRLQHPALLLERGLGLGEAGGLLHGRHHLHAVLVLQGRGAGGAGLLVHCHHCVTLKNKQMYTASLIEDHFCDSEWTQLRADHYQQPAHRAS